MQKKITRNEFERRGFGLPQRGFALLKVY